MKKSTTFSLTSIIWLLIDLWSRHGVRIVKLLVFFGMLTAMFASQLPR